MAERFIQHTVIKTNQIIPCSIVRSTRSNLIIHPQLMLKGVMSPTMSTEATFNIWIACKVSGFSKTSLRNKIIWIHVELRFDKPRFNPKHWLFLLKTFTEKVSLQPK